tara:strand:+ start:2070 stop:2894 length:825 start_codon:yes stop_codon:yes gene_type:complete
VKVETYTDQKLIELEIEERFMFIGMTNFADDEGIHVNSAKMLKAEIFPADDISVEYVQNALDRMEELGLIRYNADRTLLRISNFLRHQTINRPYPSKYEFIEEEGYDSNTTHTLVRESSHPKNKNKKKKKVKTNKKKESIEFRVWYDIYPKKIAKPKAESSFNAMMKEYSLEEIMDGTTRWVQYWENAHTEKRYIPHPATFLNQERFLDLPDELEPNVEFRLDSTQRWYIGYCKKCKESSFYSKEQLTQDSKCCQDKILPNRDIDIIQDVNAEA